MTHLSNDALIAWRDHPADANRAAIVGHLASCGECAARYAELLRSEPADEAPGRFDPAAFRARGIAVREAQSRSTSVRWLVPVVAAAALVALAVLLPRLRPAPEESVVRDGPGLRAISPVGIDLVPAGPIELTWSAPVSGDTTFRVEITDAAGNVIYDGKVTGAQKLTLPADAQSQLKPGAPYHWLVGRLNARGEVVQSSPLATFTIGR